MTIRTMAPGVLLLLAACAPNIRPLQPVTENGEILPSRSDEWVEETRVIGEMERARLAADRGPIARAPTCDANGCDPDEQAAYLLRQGDEYTAANRLDLALARYDQADILRPGHPETTLRIARVLDKQLRPIEAVLRYRMFIHQMELEKIHAHGEAGAKIAEAIARAHERIVVLERR